MASQHIELPGIGSVRLYKHKSARSIRITIGADSNIRVTLPRWVPYRAGIEFVRSKQDWIAAHVRPHTILQPGQPIGKAHRLYFLPSQSATRPTTRIKGSELRVTHPAQMTSAHPNVQAAAKRVAQKALKQEAEALLPKRLEQVAAKYGFSYRSVAVKQLKSRWGSCNHKQDITLNSFLMMVPWELIDYVLVHELVHTEVLHHGTDFWERFEQAVPGAKQRRKALRAYQPSL